TPIGGASDSVNIDFVEPPVQVTLSLSNTNIAADGLDSATITALVQDTNGYAVVDGFNVNFVTTAGSLSAADVPTASGIATTTITSDTILRDGVTNPIVTITATSGLIVSTTDIPFSPGPPFSLALSASPTTIIANGFEKTIVSALVRDESNNPVKDNLYVTFSINSTIYGTYPNGTGTSDPVPTSAGYATIELTSGTTPGTPTLTARIGAKTATYNGLTLNADLTPPSVLAGYSPADLATDVPKNTLITATFSEDVQQATVENDANITVFENGSSVLKTIVYNAATRTVSIDPQDFVDGAAVTVQFDAGITDLVGLPLTPSPFTWSFTVESVSVGAPASMTISASKDLIISDNTDTAAVTAVVKDSGGGNVIDGTQIQFSSSLVDVDLGSGSGVPVIVGTVGGQASVNIRSAVNGLASITAAAVSAPAVNAAYGVEFVEPPFQLTVVPAVASIPADGLSTTTITATVNDQYANAVANGLFVNFSTSHGSLDSNSVSTVSGQSTVTITSTTFRNYSVFITANVAGTALTKTTQISFKPGPPNAVTFNASDLVIAANGADTSTITATFVDDDGNRVKDGITVTFETTDGTFSNGLQVITATTLGGDASADLTSTVSIVDIIPTITATAGAATGTFNGITMSADLTPPVPLTASPLAGSVGASLTNPLSVEFSENMNPSTITTGSFIVVGSITGVVTGTVSYDAVTRVATFTPTVTYQSNETITGTILTTATDLAGNGLASNFVWTFTTTETIAPAVPTGLQAIAFNGSVGLSWNANTEPDMDGYNISRSITSGGGFSVIDTVFAPLSSYTDTTVTNETTYYYYITAFDQLGNESTQSAEVSATPSAETAPVPPVNLAGAAGNMQVTLTWDANTETDLDGYNVYVSTIPGTYGAPDNGGILVTGTTYTVTGLPNGVPHYFVITAVDTVPLESVTSNQISVTPRYNVADLDVDNDVDGGDLAIFGLAFGMISTNPLWNDPNGCGVGIPCSLADFDGSGRVDGADLMVLVRNFGI
ncbi:MAG: Ig-like domain-containing protein, partial [Deltaproteobacteria bacterium]|nr:Ig-like domain-containing protein [Deltaproteobacteria bacterium]